MSLFAPTFQPTLFSGIPQSPTLSPTLTSISTPSTVSTSLNSSSLVLGMGVGTFLIIFFFVVLVFVFFLSFGCSSMQKFVWRSVSTIIFGIIFLCLALAPREDQYVIQSDELKVSFCYYFSLSFSFCIYITSYFFI